MSLLPKLKGRHVFTILDNIPNIREVVRLRRVSVRFNKWVKKYLAKASVKIEQQVDLFYRSETITNIHRNVMVNFELLYQTCPHITHLETLLVKSIRCSATELPDLIKLTVFAPGLDHVEILDFVRKCPNLQEIILSYWGSFTLNPEGFSTKIKSIHFLHCYLSYENFEQVIKYHKSSLIEVVFISDLNASWPPDRNLFSILSQHCKLLQKVRVKSETITDFDALKDLHKLTCISVLTFKPVPFSEAAHVISSNHELIYFRAPLIGAKPAEVLELFQKFAPKINFIYYDEKLDFDVGTIEMFHDGLKDLRGINQYHIR